MMINLYDTQGARLQSRLLEAIFEQFLTEIGKMAYASSMTTWWWKIWNNIIEWTTPLFFIQIYTEEESCRRRALA